MTSVVLDASAVLAALLGEPGSEIVETKLSQSLVSAVNYSEIIARTARLNGSLEEAKRRIDQNSLAVVPFDADQAATAASLIPQAKSLGLSLADRACLTLAIHRQLPVFTADRKWSELDVGVRIEIIR